MYSSAPISLSPLGSKMTTWESTFRVFGSFETSKTSTVTSERPGGSEVFSVTPAYVARSNMGPMPMLGLSKVNWPCASLLVVPTSAMLAMVLSRVTSTLAAGLPVVRFMTVPWTVPATAAVAASSATSAMERRRGPTAFIEHSGPQQPDGMWDEDDGFAIQ